MSYSLEFKLEGLPKLPNSLLGAHWTVRSGHAKTWKRKVWVSVWPYKPNTPLKTASLVLTRVSSVEPDYDGLVGSFKAIIDGLVEAKILETDKPSCVGNPKYFWEKGKPGHGEVRVRVEGGE